MVNLDWHLCRYHRGYAIWAFHRQKDRLIELLELQPCHLTQTLLHCCFVIYSQGGPAERVRRAVSFPRELAAQLQREVQLNLLRHSR